MICMFINDAIWWNTAAFVTYFVDWYFIYIIRGNFIKFANKYVKECFVIYYFMDVFVGYTVIVTIYDVWSPHTGWISGKWLQYAWYVTNVFLLGTCLFRTPFPWPLIVSRDHYALLYNIVCLIVLFVRKINWNIAGSLKTLLHDEGHL